MTHRIAARALATPRPTPHPVASILRDNDPARSLTDRLLMLVATDEEREQDLAQWASDKGVSLNGSVVA